MSELWMNAYYYGFDETGVREIDLVLSAVASAGKAYHHTQYWVDDGPDGGPSEADKIQWVANDAAEALRAAWAERDAAVARAETAEQECDQLRRGGEELGKTLLYWLELAREVTNSNDVIGDDGDGDWGLVAERLSEMQAPKVVQS